MGIENILFLLEEGLTQKEVAERLGISYGELRYQITKYRSTADVSVEGEEHYTCEIDDFETIDENYGLDRLIAMPRDYESLYVYWEITDGRKCMVEEHFHCSWAILPKFLRIYDVTLIDFNGDNANRHWNNGIHNDANNWFVNGLMPDCSYIVDYGTTTLDGKFITILRSNAVKIPPKEENYRGLRKNIEHTEGAISW